jgi:hypothetical protein
MYMYLREQMQMTYSKRLAQIQSNHSVHTT